MSRKLPKTNSDPNLNRQSTRSTLASRAAALGLKQDELLIGLDDSLTTCQNKVLLNNPPSAVDKKDNLSSTLIDTTNNLSLGAASATVCTANNSPSIVPPAVFAPPTIFSPAIIASTDLGTVLPRTSLAGPQKLQFLSAKSAVSSQVEKNIDVQKTKAKDTASVQAQPALFYDIHFSDTESDKSDSSAPKSKNLDINIPDHTSDSGSEDSLDNTVKPPAPFLAPNDSTPTNDSEDSLDLNVAYRSAGKRVTFSEAASDFYSKVVSPVANLSFTSKLKFFFFGAPPAPIKKVNPIEKVEEQYRIRTPTAPQLIQTSIPNNQGKSSSLPIQGSFLAERPGKKFSSAENVVILSPTSSSIQPPTSYLVKEGLSIVHDSKTDDFYTPTDESVKEEHIASPVQGYLWDDFNPTPLFYRNQGSHSSYPDLPRADLKPPQKIPRKQKGANPNTRRLTLYDEPIEGESADPNLTQRFETRAQIRDDIELSHERDESHQRDEVLDLNTHSDRTHTDIETSDRTHTYVETSDLGPIDLSCNKGTQDRLNFPPVFAVQDLINTNISEDFDQKQFDQIFFEDDMAGAHLLLPFRGAYSENPQMWLSHFELWASTQRQLTERAKLAHFALYMKDAAQIWVTQFVFVDPPRDKSERLPPEDVCDFEDLKRRFLERFRRPDAAWQEVSNLFEREQDDIEGVEAYVNDMQRRGAMCGATPDNIRCAALNGLKPYLKGIILQHNVENLDDVVKWGVIAERTAAKDSSDTASALADLKKMLEKVQQDNAKMAQTVALQQAGQNNPLLPLEEDTIQYVNPTQSYAAPRGPGARFAGARPARFGQPNTHGTIL